MLLRRLEGERLEIEDIALPLFVGRVQADVESQTGFQSGDSENGISRRDVAHQFACLCVVHFHDEFLR